MAINFSCPNCAARFSGISDTAAGRRAKCNKCGTQLQIPAASNLDDDEILAILGNPPNTSSHLPTTEVSPQNVNQVQPVVEPSHQTESPTVKILGDLSDQGDTRVEETYRLMPVEASTNKTPSLALNTVDSVEDDDEFEHDVERIPANTRKATTAIESGDIDTAISRVQLGLRFHLAATAIVLMGIVAFYYSILSVVVGVPLAGEAEREVARVVASEDGTVRGALKPTDGQLVVLAIGLAAIFIGGVLMLLAIACEIPCALLCLVFPDSTARRFVLASLVLRFLIVPVGIWFLFSQDHRRTLALVILGLTALSWCLWLCFLHCIGRWLNSKMLEDEAEDLLSSSCVLPILPGIVLFLLYIAVIGGPLGIFFCTIGLIGVLYALKLIYECTIIEALLALTCFTWVARYFSFIQHLRDELTRRRHAEATERAIV